MGILMNQKTTVAVGGQSIGNPPSGPLSPSFEPVHNLIRGMYLNLKGMDWFSEISYHRPQGVMPNTAPAGLTFRGSRISTASPRKTAVPTPIQSSTVWAGLG